MIIEHYLRDRIVVTTDGDGNAVAVSLADEDGKLVECLWTSPTKEESAKIRKKYNKTMKYLKLYRKMK